MPAEEHGAGAEPDSPASADLLQSAYEAIASRAGNDKSADEELRALTLSVESLEQQISDEEQQIAEIERGAEAAAAALVSAQAQRAGAEAQLKQRRRLEARQQAGAKLLQLQLTVATQLYGVAESLSQVAATPSGRARGADKVLPDAVRQRDRENDELRRALKRQQQLTADAHRQLLELSTRKRPLGAAAQPHDNVYDLRTALAEQEMRRLMAEARADELAAQVRLFEERGLRLRLHPAQAMVMEEDMPALEAAPPKTPSAGGRLCM
jgi:chromosome segregation ATPase